MDERCTQIVSFFYPYKLYSFTFVTPKAEYKPQISGIYQTFSLSLWIAFISVLVTISLVYCVILKQKYSYDKIALHNLEILLRQSFMLRPSSISENLLMYAWVGLYGQCLFVSLMIPCFSFFSLYQLLQQLKRYTVKKLQ